MAFHTVTLLENAAAPANGTSYEPTQKRVSFHAILSGTGQVDCVVKVRGSNDNVNFTETEFGTITLSNAGGSANDGLIIDAPWKYVRPELVSISGTAAKATVIIGE